MKTDDVVFRIEKGMLRWSRCVERMSEERLPKGVYNVSIARWCGQGRKKYAAQISSIVNKRQVKSTRIVTSIIKCQMNMEETQVIC